MKLKHLTLLSTAFVFSLQASAVGNPKADRWFEMEVILFSQLGDKAKLKDVEKMNLITDGSETEVTVVSSTSKNARGSSIPLGRLVLKLNKVVKPASHFFASLVLVKLLHIFDHGH